MDMGLAFYRGMRVLELKLETTAIHVVLHILRVLRLGHSSKRCCGA